MCFINTTQVNNNIHFFIMVYISLYLNNNIYCQKHLQVIVLFFFNKSIDSFIINGSMDCMRRSNTWSIFSSFALTINSSFMVYLTLMWSRYFYEVLWNLFFCHLIFLYQGKISLLCFQQELLLFLHFCYVFLISWAIFRSQ